MLPPAIPTCLCTLALLLAPATGLAQQRPPEAGRVLSAEGETVLMRAGAFSSPVPRGATVRSGDVLRTAQQARVRLKMLDEGLVALEPHSEFRVAEYRFDARSQRSFFDLVRGTVRVVSGAIGKRDAADFRLSTPTATIGIRGTEFIAHESDCTRAACAAGESAGLTVSVMRGRVVVTSAAGVVEVPAGRTLFISNAAPAMQPPAGPARRLPVAPRAGATTSAASGDGDWLTVDRRAPLPADAGARAGQQDLRTDH